jgi:hypothetical protein
MTYDPRNSDPVAFNSTLLFVCFASTTTVGNIDASASTITEGESAADRDENEVGRGGGVATLLATASPLRPHVEAFLDFTKLSTLWSLQVPHLKRKLKSLRGHAMAKGDPRGREGSSTVEPLDRAPRSPERSIASER